MPDRATICRQEAIRRTVERGSVSRVEFKYFTMSDVNLKITVSSVDLVQLLYTSCCKQIIRDSFVFLANRKMGVQCRGKFWMSGVRHFLPLMSGVGITPYMGPIRTSGQLFLPDTNSFTRHCSRILHIPKFLKYNSNSRMGIAHIWFRVNEIIIIKLIYLHA